MLNYGAICNTLSGGSLMLFSTNPIQRLCSLFTEKPCWKIEPLAAEMNYSVPSVRRFLNEAGYYSSFTHNGVWYTLRSIPDFGKDGLWFKDDIGFSRVSSLTATLIELINHSRSGLTAEELGEKLHCRCHAVLVRLCRDRRLDRRKQGRSYVYLAVDTHISNAQRHALAMKSFPAEQLPAEIALIVLVEFIKNPTSNFEDLAKVIKKINNVTVSLAQIERLFAAYGLKKTMPTAEPTH